MALYDVYQNSYQAYIMTIKFSELVDSEGVSLGLDDYTATIRPDIEVSDRLIRNTSFNWQRGNDDVDAFGMAESSTAMIEVVDRDGTLNPSNVDSPYYGYLLAGIPVEVYVSSDVDTTKTPGTDAYFIWQPYGRWLTVSFNAELSSGSYAPVQVALEDYLNTIGQRTIENPDEEGTAVGFVNQTASSLLANVFAITGIPQQYINMIIPSSTFTFSAMFGELVRDVINRVCNTLALRCYTRRDGLIYIEPNTGVSDNNHHTWTVDGMTALTSEITNFAMYNEVYLKYSDKSTNVRLLGSNTVDLEQGLNTIVIYFGSTAYDVRAVRAYVGVGDPDDDESESHIFDGEGTFDIRIWQAWNNGIQLVVYASADIPSVTLEVYGGTEKLSQNKKKVSIPIGNVQTAASMRYNIEYDGLLSDEQAQILAVNAANAVKMQSTIKRLNNTYYSLFMQAGDKIVIQNCGPSFNGTYIVNKVDISAGENYSLSAELLQLDI